MHLSALGAVLRAAVLAALVVCGAGSQARGAIYSAAVGANWQLADLQVTGGAAEHLFVMGGTSVATSTHSYGNAHAYAAGDDTPLAMLDIGDMLQLHPAAWGDATVEPWSLAESSSRMVGSMFFMNLGPAPLTVTVGLSLIPESSYLLEAAASVDGVLEETAQAAAGIRFVDALGQETTLFSVLADGVAGPTSASDGADPYSWATTLTIDSGSTAELQVITEARGDAFVNPEPGAVVIWSVLGLVGVGVLRVRARRGNAIR